MVRSIDEIAKEIAQDAVSVAQCAGYEPRPDRDLFFRSDMGLLEDRIWVWLNDHMQPRAK